MQGMNERGMDGRLCTAVSTAANCKLLQPAAKAATRPLPSCSVPRSHRFPAEAEGSVESRRKERDGRNHASEQRKRQTVERTTKKKRAGKKL